MFLKTNKKTILLLVVLLILISIIYLEKQKVSPEIKLTQQETEFKDGKYEIILAVELFNEGKVSLGRAAEIAEVSTIEFKKILADRKIMRNINISSSASRKSVMLIKSKR